MRGNGRLVNRQKEEESFIYYEILTPDLIAPLWCRDADRSPREGA